VSVVTPVYNGEDYLEECIQSVVNQTFSDWELLILDNVSTDSSSVIADRFAAQDSRIRVLRASEFLDAIDNHNRSLRAMDPRSRYCKFLQADDWIYPECLELMTDIAERHPTVGVVSSYRLVDKRVNQESPMIYPQTVMPGLEAVRWELLGPQGSAWVTGSNSSLLIRSDFVRQRFDFYDRTMWNADTDAAYRVLMQSDLGFVHQILTYTRRHVGAQMGFDLRVWTFIARDGRLLMRYGPKFLDAPAYRAETRKWLWRYGYWLAKQALKPSRQRQREFHEYHSREIGYMMAESGGDRETQMILLGLRRFLLRGSVD
jgi:glycosyltransferase involved in cell wall biosynthesis